MISEITKEDLLEFEQGSHTSQTASHTPDVEPVVQPQTPKDLPNEDPNEWKPDKYETLPFESPAEFLAFFTPIIANGTITLHKWQVEVNELIAKAPASSQHPFKFSLCANNGSGKDYTIISPVAMWIICCHIRASVIITTASGTQLTAQTENYIRTLASSVNAFYKQHYGVNILKINQRHIKCLLSGSEIRMFATDEEGKAEGYHPLEPGALFVIIVNEAKTVAPEIFRALRRCTGFTHWLNISTPGEPVGDFYYSFTHWPNARRITKYDCPHLSEEEFEADKIELGEHSPLFRSKWLALFTTIGGQTVVSQISLERLKQKLEDIKQIGKTWPIRVGIDLSAGGDEIVLSAWRGNYEIKKVTFREIDTTLIAIRLDRELKDLGLQKDHEYIFADDGGVGHAIIDMLQEKGWHIRRVINQSTAHNKKDFRNRGAELAFKVARFIEECIIRPLNDPKTFEQAALRHYKKSDTGITKITLESKAEAKARGVPSPDRFDAMVLAFTDVSLQMFFNGRVEEAPKAKIHRTWEELEEALQADNWRQKKPAPINRSLLVMFANN